MIPTTNRAVTRSSVLRCRWQMTLTFIAALAMLPAITGAQAVQGAQKDAGLQLEEIIVTAQKRKENAQEVPIAITAVSGKSLQQMGLGNVADLSGHVPNIDIKNTVSFAGSSQILVAAIRGIGQNDFAFNLEPGVGVYIDGVYYARSLGAVVDLLDLERIEVLKGPQGTLFGRNTIGGALNVVTRDPEKEFKSQLEATTGRFNRTDLRASIDVPLIDNTLLSQLSFSSKRRDGYQKRIPFPGQAGTISDEGNFLTAGTPGGSDTQGGENSLNVRGKFKWIPSDNFKVLLSGDYTNARQEARPATLIKTFAGPTDGTALTAYNGCIFGAAPPFICSKRGTVNTSFFGVNVDADPNNNRLPVSDAFVNGNIDSSYARGSNYDNLESWGLSATADWTLSDDMSLKSITAYRTLDSTFGSEIAAAPIVANDASFAMNQLQFSEELQFNLNSFDQRLRSVFGLYYFRESGGLTDYVVFGEGLIQVYGPNDFKNKAFAAFMHENLAITEQWGLTLGVRLTDEKKEFEGFQHDLNSFFIRTRGVDPNGPLPASILSILPDPADPTLLYPMGSNHLEFKNASFRAGTEYKFTDDVMTYYSFSQGFKSGGWTTRLLDVIPGNNAADLRFNPEKADTNEIGVKSELLDHHLRLNAAMFSTVYKDMQVTVFNGISPVFSNAGKSKIDGFEVEAQARMGNLSLNAGGGHLNARYTELDPTKATFPITNSLVNTPKWTGTLSAMCDFHLPNSSQLTVGGDFSYKTSTSPDAENSPYLKSGDIRTLNGSLSWSNADDKRSVTFGIHNITDQRFIVGGFDQSHPGQVGFVSAGYSPPREWYLTLRVKM